ncbi:ESX secretion-associated protein EspG [Rhodococcus sp. BP-349]|uniref:ESX secretion-associated protein EspG n=1 Tax=unclassified Rhodococcus (in: high G+C Gram-positive bacteria) TaxID=192944 RepID=UPI001C9A3CDB|nr:MULTISPECIES: ESX secretion-associated protein EspG [unclassified Rhodococcus (in: high G+C Gram-positive bacteria)]MBY6539097.1 ESX secretion-associated protein EspG [Rhodococcus sp. BP-363]MBY6544575.1 ESX secretion-associated protein EspG [Rhodococcus sp. BP-369]MBY6563805.1 ESX secretion-associated protein EspG [Rhodococcus sp. BP-370]MBY6578097.1 ESX secretion-associated protein EspG [Rhodococcus sp. BP-364]MBY6587398.1 ESX secretion-associated protein EspG [Rhodococcus sp. BP-358]
MSRAPVLGGDDPLESSLTLDTGELTYLLDAIGGHSLPAVLGWHPAGATMTDRATVQASAARRLADRLLVSADGRPHRGLSALLRSAAAPRWSVDIRTVGHSVGVEDARACLCGNDIDDPVWLVASAGSVTVTRLDTDAAVLIAAWLGDAAGAPIDPLSEYTDVLAAGFEDVVPHCTHHTEIVGLRHDHGVATTVDPSIAVYDSDSGRVLTTTVQDPSGRSSTSVRSATPVRTVGALRSLITSLERRSILDEHLVGVSAQPIGSSGVRLPFVSNGGV